MAALGLMLPPKAGALRWLSGLLHKKGGALPDINVVSAADGRSALHQATARGHEGVAMHLVIAGADVNFRGPVERSPRRLKADFRN